jgi:hypothetical protein
MTTQLRCRSDPQAAAAGQQMTWRIRPTDPWPTRTGPRHGAPALPTDTIIRHSGWARNAQPLHTPQEIACEYRPPGSEIGPDGPRHSALAGNRAGTLTRRRDADMDHVPRSTSPNQDGLLQHRDSHCHQPTHREW